MVSSMPTASSMFTAYTAISGFIMLLQTALNQFVPRPVRSYVIDLLHRFFNSKSDSQASILIEDSSNEIYSAAEIYLCTKMRPKINHLKISKREKDTGINITFAQCEKVVDSFQGMQIEWRFVHEKTSKNDDPDSRMEREKRYFELYFDKENVDRVLDSYVPFFQERAKEIREEKKVIKMYTLPNPSKYGHPMSMSSGNGINLEHPSTFDTLAMEPSLKARIINDLNTFVGRRDFYSKVGRAWKRGYLLYGPPGTGKSSLIAAMANHLKFDICYLDLPSIKYDSDFRQLMLKTSSRSIILIEDIDCTVKLPDRKKEENKSMENGSVLFPPPPYQQFTLSGLLNFLDGLWSTCSDQRIFVITTNNKDKLDPALLRPGRMDMHIHMSYLTPSAFDILASNYLGLQNDHPRFPQIHDLIQSMKVTPAQVAGELMNGQDPHACLDDLVKFLQELKLEQSTPPEPQS